MFPVALGLTCLLDVPQTWQDNMETSRRKCIQSNARFKQLCLLSLAETKKREEVGIQVKAMAGLLEGRFDGCIFHSICIDITSLVGFFSFICWLSFEGESGIFQAGLELTKGTWNS